MVESNFTSNTTIKSALLKHVCVRLESASASSQCVWAFLRFGLPFLEIRSVILALWRTPHILHTIVLPLFRLPGFVRFLRPVLKTLHIYYVWACKPFFLSFSSKFLPCTFSYTNKRGWRREDEETEASNTVYSSLVNSRSVLVTLRKIENGLEFSERDVKRYGKLFALQVSKTFLPRMWERELEKGRSAATKKFS